MIKEIENGNIFESECKIITNAVNCIGIMGGGIAKQFATRYPQMLDEYKLFCEHNVIALGRPVYHIIQNENKIICNFPTMFYPGSITNEEDIVKGLSQLKKDAASLEYCSIALCALGCGVGRFSYDRLKELVYNIFTDYPNVVELYKPLKN